MAAVILSGRLESLPPWPESTICTWGPISTMLAPRVAELSELTRVHEVGYLEELAAFCEAGGGQLDPDTFAVGDSWLAARQAAGAGLAAVDALRAGDGDVAFVAARPPGHHALSDRAMGFCLLNNIAVSAAHWHPKESAC